MTSTADSRATPCAEDWPAGCGRWATTTSYRAGIDDADLVQISQREERLLITSDGKLLERKLITSRRVPSLRLPHGLKLLDQVRFVVQALQLGVHEDPRCMACNGRLLAAARDEVGDRVPARSLLWATQFYGCDACGQVYWDGSHWRRIEHIRRQFASASDSHTLPDTPRG